MSTIPVFSDSHGVGYRAAEVFERLALVDDYPKTAIFLGDGIRDIESGIPKNCELLAVGGNCDAWTSLFDSCGNELPDERIEMISGIRVLIMHGHKYSVKSGYHLAIARARAVGADILLFGHTHLPYLAEIPADNISSKPLAVFNPGSLRDGSFGILTVVNGKPLLSHGKI